MIRAQALVSFLRYSPKVMILPDEEMPEWKMFLPSYVHAISKDITQRSAEILNQYNLKACYLPYLVTLFQKGKATMKELTEQTGTDKSNTTRIISELREKGIVADDRKSKNSKKYNVFLTDEGRKLVIKSKHEFESSIDSLFSNLSQEELDILIEIMRKTKDFINKKTDLKF